MQPIDVADIASVIDVMASGDVNINPNPSLNTNLKKKSDVNKDGVVDVADVAAVIDEMAANARRWIIEVRI